MHERVTAGPLAQEIRYGSRRLEPSQIRSAIGSAGTPVRYTDSVMAAIMAASALALAMTNVRWRRRPSR